MKNLPVGYYMLTPTETAAPPEHKSLEAWIWRHYSNTHLRHTTDQCGRCQQHFSQKLVFCNPTWIWLKVFLQYLHIVIPAFQISLGSSTLQLAAIIYADGNHYQACLHDPSGAWWFYDSQVNRGHPTPDPLVSDWQNIFHCGGAFSITALVYCLVD